jgi:hypothetical protein
MTELAINLIRTDGGTQPRAELNYDVIQDYAQQMLEGVVFPDVVLFYDGTDHWLADGFHRYHAARQICRENINAEIRQGTRRDAVLYSVGANSTHGLRRTNADKRRAVETLLRDEVWGKWSDNQIAKQCGVNQSTVSRIRQENPSYALHKIEPRYAERNGTVYTVNTANIGLAKQEQQTSLTLAEMQALEPQPGPLYGTVYQTPTPVYTSPAPEQLQARAQYLERWQQDNLALGLDRWGDPLPYDEEDIDEIEEEYHDALAVMDDEPRTEEVPIQRRGAPAALQMSESNEWYTPGQYVEAARALMGSIDLDPASNVLANETIQAAAYYDIETNGLDKDWAGRVWLNPPYGREGGDSNQEIWSHRLIEQFQSGITTEAVLLVNANTEAKWFQPLYDYLICFTNHRIRFYNTEGTSSQPTQGNALIYFGPQKARFTELFKQFGPIVRRIA